MPTLRPTARPMPWSPGQCSILLLPTASPRITALLACIDAYVSAIAVLLSLLLRVADLPGHPSRVSSRGAIVCLLVVYMSMWFFARTIPSRPSVPHPPCVPHDQTSQTYAAEPMRRNCKAFWVESTVQGLYMPSPRSISAAQRSCMY
jgi:hypothetical protein